MSVIGEFENLYKNGKEFSKDKYAINKIASIVRKISVILTFIILFLHYWNLVQYYNVEKAPLFADELRVLLHKYTFGLLVIWIVFDTLSTPLFSRIIISIESKCKKRLLPLWNTIEDLLEVCSAGLMLVFITNALIEFSNGYNVFTKGNWKVYVLIILYFVFEIIKWVYIKNSNRWYYLEKAYTDYFDTNGNRIAKDDRVIYYGKIYKIVYARDSDESETSIVNRKKLWITEDTYGTLNLDIMLEEAVKDEKGKIRIYEYGMGEKGRK